MDDRLPNLWPREIVGRARSQSKAEFTIGLDVPVLLVRVDGLESELGIGLTEASTAGGTRLMPTLGFETVVGDLPQTAPPKLSRAPFAPAKLLAALVRSAHFVAPLRKRADSGKPFADRISVGRARNNDVVLRDASVSKFHAWFECDEEDGYYLGDARSKNTTTVNGQLVTGPDLCPLRPGDEIRFGSVEAVLCPPEILWEAIHLEG